MQEWWLSLDVFMKTLWCITIFASLVFIIQSVMTFIGMDSDTGMDLDVDSNASDSGEPFQLYTFRNFINFFLGFGWTAITLRPYIDNTFLLILPSLVVGVLLVGAVMSLFKWLSGMKQSGNIEADSAVNCTGEVYLTIPAAQNGEGKVQIRVQGAVREYDAMTPGEQLGNGTPIRVIRTINSHTVLVERA
ncbi:MULTISPECIES: hypothetical protein [Bacteroides]|uniref:hypothetical protein n=2 Tax=Bacteroides TaxID=816 RepID=UPI0004B955F6|nr:hypothetical protein [Bacteroides neonati]MCP3895200.1 hypothetical protein [Bacteroides sp.]